MRRQRQWLFALIVISMIQTGFEGQEKASGEASPVAKQLEVPEGFPKQVELAYLSGSASQMLLRTQESDGVRLWRIEGSKVAPVMFNGAPLKDRHIHVDVFADRALAAVSSDGYEWRIAHVSKGVAEFIKKPIFGTRLKFYVAGGREWLRIANVKDEQDRFEYWSIEGTELSAVVSGKDREFATTIGLEIVDSPDGRVWLQSPFGSVWHQKGSDWYLEGKEAKTVSDFTPKIEMEKDWIQTGRRLSNGAVYSIHKRAAGDDYRIAHTKDKSGEWVCCQGVPIEGGQVDFLVGSDGNPIVFCTNFSKEKREIESRRVYAVSGATCRQLTHEIPPSCTRIRHFIKNGQSFFQFDDPSRYVFTRIDDAIVCVTERDAPVGPLPEKETQFIEVSGATFARSYNKCWRVEAGKLLKLEHSAKLKLDRTNMQESVVGHGANRFVSFMEQERQRVGWIDKDHHIRTVQCGDANQELPCMEFAVDSASLCVLEYDLRGARTIRLYRLPFSDLPNQK